MIAVNKADGDNAGEARVTARELSIAMKLVATDADRRVPVLTCSALHKVGLTEVWQAVLDHREYLESKYGLANYRAAQQVEWMWSQTEVAVMDTLHSTHTMRTLARELETQVFGTPERHGRIRRPVARLSPQRFRRWIGHNPRADHGVE